MSFPGGAGHPKNNQSGQGTCRADRFPSRRHAPVANAVPCRAKMDCNTRAMSKPCAKLSKC
eukprot:5704369-Alexandrium_andersonii.AAC.1